MGSRRHVQAADVIRRTSARRKNGRFARYGGKTRRVTCYEVVLTRSSRMTLRCNSLASAQHTLLRSCPMKTSVCSLARLPAAVPAFPRGSSAAALSEDSAVPAAAPLTVPVPLEPPRSELPAPLALPTWAPGVAAESEAARGGSTANGVTVLVAPAARAVGISMPGHVLP